MMLSLRRLCIARMSPKHMLRALERANKSQEYSEEVDAVLRKVITTPCDNLLLSEAVTAASRMKQWDTALQAFWAMYRDTALPERTLTDALAAMTYARPLHHSLWFLRSVAVQTAEAYELVIARCVRDGELELASTLRLEMREFDLGYLSLPLCRSLAELAAKAGNAQLVLDLIVEDGHKSLWDMVVLALLNSNELEMAKDVVHQMKKSGTPLTLACYQVLLKTDCISDLGKVLDLLNSIGHPVNSTTALYALEALTGDLIGTRKVMSELNHSPLSDECIQVCLKTIKKEEAADLVLSSRTKNPTCFNMAMVSNPPETVLKLFHELRGETNQKCHNIDVESYRRGMRAAQQLQQHELIKSMFNLMEIDGVSPDTWCYSLYTDACDRTGDQSNSTKLYSSLFYTKSGVVKGVEDDSPRPKAIKDHRRK